MLFPYLALKLWIVEQQIGKLGPLLHQQTGAEVRELAPKLSSDKNLSGEQIEPSLMAGTVGALLG